MSADAERRKAAIRAYKETARPMGVFAVRNTVTGTVFVGSTVDLPSMLNRQRFQLEAGGHPSFALQAEWDAHGREAFAFEVVDTLEPSEEPGYDPAEDLRVLEALWRDRLGVAGNCS